ncbi:MAG: glycine cleavage system aminomethyltransferase GcvT [Betaproteobacteria bacterium]
MALRTPLYDMHLASGARLTDFGGWDMPLHYGSQLEEHHRVRTAAGMFDVSHMLGIDVAGPGALAFLQRLLANDVAKLDAPGRALYSCMLNPSGGVVDDLVAIMLDPQRYRLVVNAATADKDLAWLRTNADEFRVTITPRRDLAMIAVQGPQAREAVWAAHPELRAATEGLMPFTATEHGSRLIARTGYTGEDGFEIALAAADAPALWQALRAEGVAPCGLAARDTLRLEAGMSLYGNDMTEATSPLESGLGWTVDRKAAERDFVGRPALEAAAPRRALVGLKLLDRGVLRSHMRVTTPAGEGEITSGTFSPTLGFSIALARVPRAGEAGPAVGTEVAVDMRGKPMPARIVKYPFVRHGKALIS